MAANSEIIASYHAELVVDHNQLLLHDCEFDFREADLDLLYKESAPRSHLGVASGVLAIFTARWNGPVPLDVVVCTSPPNGDLSGWDNVGEASIALPSGCAVIYAPESFESGLRFAVFPGVYRVRVYSGGWEGAMEYEYEGPDYYKMTLWKAPHTEPMLLRGVSGKLT
jgi:hypothetical protein